MAAAAGLGVVGGGWFVCLCAPGCGRAVAGPGVVGGGDDGDDDGGGDGGRRSQTGSGIGTASDTGVVGRGGVTSRGR